MTESAKYSIVIARPATTSRNDLKEFSWVSSLSHRYLQFRFGAISQIKIVDPDTLSVQIRGYSSYGEASPSEQSYFSAAKKLNATHVLFPKFETEKSGKTLQFSLTLSAVDDPKNTVKGESSAGIDNLDACLDSCVSQLLATWGVQPEAYASKFFRTSLTGSGKCNKAAGNAMASTSSSGSVHKKTADDLKKCISQDPQAYLMYFLGALEYAKAKEYENAGLLLKDLIYKLGPVYPSLYPRAALYFRLCDKYEEGLQMIKLCEGLNMQAENLVEEKARLLEGIEDWNNAQDAYQQVLSSDPGNYHALLFLVKKYNKDKQPDKALDQAMVFLRSYPDDGVGVLEKGKALFALQRFREALPVLSQAAELLPKNMEPLQLQGDIYQHDNEYKKAIQSYSRALELAPDNVSFNIKIAHAYMLMKNPSAALAELKKVEKKYYDNPEVQKGIGLAEYDLGDNAAAKRDLARCAQGGEPDITVCLTLAQLYYNSDEYEKSLEMFEKALKIDPGNSDADKYIRVLKLKIEGAGSSKDLDALRKSQRRSGISAITMVRVISGVLCVAGWATGYYMNTQINKLQTEYSNSQNTNDVNSYHTRLKNTELVRNAMYGVGGLTGIAFGITFAIPSGNK